ncbi:MAG: N-6 DNA methylase [Kiritimatiellae bacterium]|nr:N-6 DNA methylase [Kiritimatiellia bacterium]
MDISKSPLERNKLGQFSTPFTLAKQMVRFGETLLPPNLSECNVLEPACGSGVFFSAFSCLGPTKHHFTGVEIDSKYADICMNLFGNMNLTVKVQDFFKWFYDTDEKNRFKLLVTNPPYVRHHHLNHDRKIELQAEVKKRLGIRVSGLSGLYIYYMLLSHDLLTSGGVASWLIPSEFMYTNYGSALREYLKEHVTLIRIHRFQPKDVQFDDALVSSCVITYTKNKPEDQSAVTLTSGDYETPSELRNILQKDCLSTEKWAFFDQSKPSLESGLPLDALFHITRGLATGNNEFFLLGSKEVKESGIKSKFLVPVLPSPRYLKNNLIESDEFGTPLVKGVKFLISAKLEIRQLRKQDPNLATYLEEGEKRGVANGYICRNRKIWYAQENRQPPRFVASYMGRGAADGSSPIRFFLNRSAALATNVFLCLYPRPFLLKLLENHPEREEELLYFLNNIPDHVIQRMGRCYGGGLQKVEPKELRSIPLQNSPEWLKVLRTEQIELFPTKGGEDKFHYSVAANE